MKGSLGTITQNQIPEGPGRLKMFYKFYCSIKFTVLVQFTHSSSILKIPSLPVSLDATMIVKHTSRYSCKFLNFVRMHFYLIWKSHCPY